MENINHDSFREYLYRILLRSVSEEYAGAIADNDEFFHAVLSDVETASAWSSDGYYSEDDIRLAIGRAIINAYHIER